MVSIVTLVFSIGCFACFIMVLIKQFQQAGAIHGIIGIVTCSIWTFIWGWINADRFKIKILMFVWTVLISLDIISRIS